MKRRTFLQSAIGASATLAAFGSLQTLADQTLAAWQHDLKTLNEPGFWENVKSQFQLSPEITHLNSGSIGACPRIVTDTLVQLTRQIEQDPYRNFWGDGLCQQLETVRETAARFINASLDEVAITRNTTEGMNLIARALELGPGDEIVTSNREHPGGFVCWKYIAQRTGAKIRLVKFPKVVQDSEEVTELIKKQMTNKCKVLSFCHIDTITGLILPIQQISRLAQAHNAFFVCDGAQAPGMLSVDVKKLGVDAYASSSHKWAMAPKGSGLLYLAKPSQKRLNSLELSSGFNVYTAANGTRNIAQILAHETALKFHETVGKKKIETRIRNLNNLLSDKLLELDAIRCLTPRKSDLACGISTFEIDHKIITSHAVADKLRRESKVYVKAVPATASMDIETNTPEDYNAIRISTHIFNNEKEIDRAVDCITALLKA